MITYRLDILDRFRKPSGYWVGTGVGGIGQVDLQVAGGESVGILVILSPDQARRLAVQLLENAEAAEKPCG